MRLVHGPICRILGAVDHMVSHACPFRQVRASSQRALYAECGAQWLQAGVRRSGSTQRLGSTALPCPQCTPGRAPSEGAAMLETALQTERKAVNVFLTRVTEEILNPLQEAWLDACAPTRPWCVHQPCILLDEEALPPQMQHARTIAHFWDADS